MLLSILAQTAAVPPEGVPAWLWILLTAVGTFVTANMPWVRAQLDAAFKARRGAAKLRADELNERLLAAQETTAKALASIAESNRATADALNIFASHRAADSLALDEIRRDLRRLRGEPEPAERITPRRRRAAAADADSAPEAS